MPAIQVYCGCSRRIKRLPEKCFIMYTAYLLQAMEMTMSAGLGLYLISNPLASE